MDLEIFFAVGYFLAARGAVIRGVSMVAGRIWDSKCRSPTA